VQIDSCGKIQNGGEQMCFDGSTTCGNRWRKMDWGRKIIPDSRSGK